MSSQQLLILADDFSGAGEMAGIALRYGRRVELQLDFRPGSDAEVVVYDSDTRRLSGPEAGEKIRVFAEAVLASGKDFSLFKKIDSVLRGHVIREAEILHRALRKKQTLLLPANPSKKRLVIEEQYYIDGQPINRTPFREDPDFPRSGSFLPDLLDQRGRHRHLAASTQATAPGLFTCDIPSPSELDRRIEIRPDRLYCGAADAFERFLQKLIGAEPRKPYLREPIEVRADLFLLINGSTHRAVNEALVAGCERVKRAVLPPEWLRVETALTDTPADSWIDELDAAWKRDRLLFLSTPKEILPGKAAPARIVDLLADIAQALLQRNRDQRIHVFATGGATASALIRRIGEGSLTVIGEMAPGVVTIADEYHRNWTAKPGSYPWPKVIFK